MKLNFKSYLIIPVMLLLASTSCDEGDAIVDDVVDNTTRGAILRTVNVVSNELPIGEADGFFGVDLEVQDSENGALVQSIDVFANFQDNTPDNGVGATTPESFVENIASSTFTIGEFDLPRFTYQITLPELLAITGVSESDIDGGDEFRVRFELVLSDGRRFSFADNSGTLTGSFFSSPFLYGATIVCPPSPPAAGDWIFDMTDAYGDGWNGASLTVTLDGEEMEFLVDGSEGGASLETLTVPTDAEVISIRFTSGNWDGEIGYTITSANGNVILTQEAYADTTPTPGVELINYCVKNY
ncbi:hypothetical protein GGR42_003247 [Saonia flava]|uniref:Uncharacterized protein n=1 Tax=Saonia flava TaxID=523696 RepID=A0A846QUZ3_9FLAO|nr:hypothetical protein [Saonia flava]NJB72756.1 hypothetical protein [Saonia flava]